MKLVRYGAIGQEKPGLIDKSGQLRDLSAQVKDLNGEAYAPASLAKLAALDPATLPAVSGKPRLGAPVTGISKFVAIGLNYVDHAKETTRSNGLANPRSSTGKSKSPPSSAPAPNTSPRPTPSTTSPDTAFAMTSRNAISSRSAGDNGPRANRTTLSARSDRGWSPGTRLPTCRSSRCGSTSTASAARPDRLRP
jgi:hypothetical protein